MEKSKFNLEQAIALSSAALEQPIQQDSDLTGVIKILNEDVLEKSTNLPSIDMKTRLQPIEVTSILVHDTVIALKCLPKVCLITTRIKKRLAISEHGKGRDEMVRIVQGEREKQSSGGFMNKIKSWVTPTNKE